MSFPALSELTRGSQVPLRNAVPADAPGRSHARWAGRRVIRGNWSLPPITGLFLTRRSHLGGATSASADAMGTIPAMPDELSVDVFTELRRVTSAAIKLEDYVEGLSVLAARTRSATRDEAAEWLEHVRQAIERLNAAMHATMGGEISRSLGTPIPRARFPEQCVDSRLTKQQSMGS